MRKFLLFAFFFIVGTASGQEGFEARLAAASARTRSIECDFVLTRTMGVMEGGVVSRGRFYYLRDVGISLDFAEPAGDRITIGEGRFCIVSGGRTTVVSADSNPALRMLQRMLSACMTGDVAALGHGAAVECKELSEAYIVTLEPRRGAVGRIEMTFDKATMTLSRLRMEERGGDVSEYVFTNKKINSGVDAGRFAI